MEEVLTGSERSLRVNRSCFFPPPTEGFAAPEALRFAGVLGWRWLSGPCMHILSEAICTLNHELRAFCS